MVANSVPAGQSARFAALRSDALHHKGLAYLPLGYLLPFHILNVPCLFELISSLLIQQGVDL